MVRVLTEVIWKRMSNTDNCHEYAAKSVKNGETEKSQERVLM